MVMRGSGEEEDMLYTTRSYCYHGDVGVVKGVWLLGRAIRF